MTSVVNTFVETFNSKLEKPVRDHLKKVFACLTLCTVAAGVGAYVHMYTETLSAGFSALLASVAFLVAVLAIPGNDRNRNLRMGCLFGFSFFAGIGMGPLFEAVLAINPSIIMTAFLATVVIFGSFTLSAIFAERGKWLYLGGTLTTLLASVLVLSVANLYFRSYVIFQAHLYLGLLVMCGFVLYDIQLIIEKRRHGDKDFVAHALDLFIDFVGIFKRLVIILSDKEQQKRKRQN